MLFFPVFAMLVLILNFICLCFLMDVITICIIIIANEDYDEVTLNHKLHKLVMSISLFVGSQWITILITFLSKWQIKCCFGYCWMWMKFANCLRSLIFCTTHGRTVAQNNFTFVTFETKDVFFNFSPILILLKFQQLLLNLRPMLKFGFF